MDGTYGFVYCGFEGPGMGIFRLENSRLVGADFAGSRYRGQVAIDEATGEIDLSFDMTVPPGVSLVQGTSAQNIPYTKRGRVKVPPAFGDGEPFQIFVAPGPVTMMVKRIPEEYKVRVRCLAVTRGLDPRVHGWPGQAGQAQP